MEQRFRGYTVHIPENAPIKDFSIPIVGTLTVTPEFILGSGTNFSIRNQSQVDSFNIPYSVKSKDIVKILSKMHTAILSQFNDHLHQYWLMPPYTGTNSPFLIINSFQ